MNRWIKSIFLSVTAAALSVITLTGPVFATGTNPSTPDNPGTPAQVATPNPDPEPTPTDETMPTCYDQVGGLGWLICPGTGFLANVIDGAYQLLENLLQVNPLPTDPDAPMHVVWEYMRGITNVIFVILFLVVIYSQLTGIGINNYGVKRILPRLIIAAILINLSYIICTLAVDVSNILGRGFRSVFQTIQEQAIANGSINEIAATTSTAGIVATLLGIGTIGTVAALTFSGGVTGLIWLLIPIIFAGAIAIISAVITMAARQALIFLLVMISPLAFVAYLLPNTEKWFTKWYQMFFRMIFFYPIFSILYGATQLAGFVTITSATDWLGVVLGVAIQVLPLFMSIPLMRMSGTVLGGIGALVARASAPATRAVNRRAVEGQTLARQRQLASTSNIPHNRLARWLEQRRTNRRFDTTELAKTNADKYTAGAYSSLEKRDRDGNRRRLTGRGVRYNTMLSQRMRANITRSEIETDFDEGFGGRDENGNLINAATGIPIVRSIRNARIQQTNEDLQDIVVEEHIAAARKRSVTRDNAISRANRIRSSLSTENGNNPVNTQVHRQITSAFRLDNNPTPNSQEAMQVKNALNSVLAEAITTKRKADGELKSNYLELYDDLPAGPEPQNRLIEAFDTGDYNSATAAMAIMAKRGDHGDIIRTLVENSDKLKGDQHFAMQKNLADAALGLKKENLYLWGWAKANMIRRSMNGKGMDVDPYIDMATFLSGRQAPGDAQRAQNDADRQKIYNSTKKASLQQIFTDLNGWSTIATQDRTVFKEMFSLIQDGIIPTPVDANGNPTSFPLLFPEKYIRSAATSGLMDGEQLATLNNLLVGGYKKGVPLPGPGDPANDNTWFSNHMDIVEKQIMSYLKNMSANQLVASKSSTITSINDALLAIHPNDIVIPRKVVDGQPMDVSSHLYEAFNKERDALKRPSAINQVNSMNKSIREMLDINPAPASGSQNNNNNNNP